MNFTKLFILLTLCIGLSSSSLAQVLTGAAASKKVAGAEMLRISERTGNIDYIKLTPAAEVELSKSEAWLKQVFYLGNESSWIMIGDEKDLLGRLHYRYQQLWNGVPIRDAIFILHTQNGKIFSVNGTLYPDLQIQNQVVLTQNAAMSFATNYVGASEYIWENASEEQLLKQMTKNPAATYKPEGQIEIVYDNNTNGFYYSWCFDIYAKKPLSRQDIYVDAADGSIRLTLNKIHTADSLGSAVTKYSGTKPLTSDYVGPNSYRLRETGRGDGIQTWDMNEGTNYGSAVDFTDTDNFWNNANAQQDEVGGDAHWGTEVTYDYFMLEHGRNSIDDAGFALISYVHYDVAYGNAFWDGQRMTYGDGDGSTTAFTALDITAHEITHGMTSFTANLDYVDESGALSEGFSDIFGTCAEYYGKPALANWTCGEDIGIIIRSLSNPNSSGNPDTYLGTNWDPGQEVHQNSTVCSHWFYRLSEGGSGTNDNGDAYSVTAQGKVKASDIAYLTLTGYLTSTSGYADARFYSIIAASDIYGGCSPEVESTTDAWYAVGVGSNYVPNVVPDFSADYTSMCSAPLTVQFSNTTVNANTYLWKFGDGTTSTLTHPSHTYASPGNYNVKLIGYGGSCGIDSLLRNSYISINTSNTAAASLPSNGIGMVQTCCTGTLSDNGGTGDYTNSSNSTITIAPTGAMGVTLTFSSFNLESGYDYLYIYDGPTTASPQIGVYDGSSLPNGGIVSSTGSSITLQQINDAGVVASGFALSWQCSMPNAAPVTNFMANVKETCTGLVQFTDVSTNGPVSWLWTFGDGSTSTLQHPLHAYLSSGTFNVKLRSGNGFGSDSLIKNSYITVNLPSAPAVTPAAVCDSSSATLAASGSGQLDWYTAAVGGSMVGSGNTYVTPVLYVTTTYYVEDKIIHPSQYGGRLDNSGQGGNFTSASNIHYEIFDCYTPLTLVSVKVYAEGAGNRTIQLRDSAFNVLESQSIYIPDGESRISLNFSLPVQNNLQLVGNGDMNLYRNNNGAGVYPYTLAGMFSITESSASLPPYNVMGNYYYFYDWEVSQPTCISARVPVEATVTECNTVDELNGLPSFSVSPNPTNGLVSINYFAEQAGMLSLTVTDITGRVLQHLSSSCIAGKNNLVLDFGSYSTGVYFIKGSSAQGNSIIRIVRN